MIDTLCAQRQHHHSRIKEIITGVRYNVRGCTRSMSGQKLLDT